MENFNFIGLFRELRYIAVSVVLSIIGVLIITFIHDHTGVVGTVFFAIIMFLTFRLLANGLRAPKEGRKMENPNQEKSVNSNSNNSNNNREFNNKGDNRPNNGGNFNNNNQRSNQSGQGGNNNHNGSNGN